MGLLEILTIIFVVCKLAGVITWSWWLVFSPILVAVGLYVIIFVGYVIAALKLKGNAEKSFKDFEEKAKRGKF